MTDSDLTLIGVLVDRSGSMTTCRTDMEGGLNTFLAEQATQPGQLDVTLAQFDTEYELVWEPTRVTDGNVALYTLVPRGNTALLDAMGRFVTEIGEALAAKPDSERPGKVIVCICTDGHENSSRDWAKGQVKELVQQQINDYGWEFVFLGANMDAVAEAGGLGIPRHSTLTFDTAHAHETCSVASGYVSGVRATGAASFSEKDRKTAMGGQ